MSDASPSCPHSPAQYCAAAVIAFLLGALAAPVAAQAPPPGDLGTITLPPSGDIINPATDDLFKAVNSNDFAGVQGAVAAGADLDATDRWGLSPIDIAVDKGYFEIAHFLLSVRNFRPPPERGSAGGSRTAAPATASPALGAPALAPREPAASPPPAEAAPAAQAARPATESSEPNPAAFLPPPQEELQPEPPRFVFPSDEPNPFDPANPVVGSTFPSVGDSAR